MILRQESKLKMVDMNTVLWIPLNKSLVPRSLCVPLLLWLLVATEYRLQLLPQGLEVGS